MKKLLLPLFAILLSAALITGCDKADMKIKKLNHGDGTWSITSIHVEYYDSLGVSVVSDSTISDPGELVFFTTTTLNGLFDYHLCVANMNESGNIHTYNFEVYFDEARVHFQPTVNGDVPNVLEALWTVNDSSRKKQEWSTFGLRNNGTLATKTTVTLKFDKR
jgi:hypothetical protein